MGRDRNESGRFDDRIPPAAVLDVFDDRDDLARPLTAGDVVDALGIARRTAHNKLNRLVERGDLETRKIGARGRVWWVPIPRDESDDTPAPVREASADAPEATDGTPDTRDATATGSRPESGSGLDGVDFPSGRDREACEAAVRAARDYLREDGPATKAELVRAIMPEHPLGYDVDGALAKIEAGDRYRGAWWRRVVSPGLAALDDVEKPPAGGSEWRYTGDP